MSALDGLGEPKMLTGILGEEEEGEGLKIEFNGLLGGKTVLLNDIEAIWIVKLLYSAPVIPDL